MATKLQKLALKRACQIIDEADKMIGTMTIDRIIAEKKINLNEDIYPIQRKLEEAKEWIQSITNNT